jgi:lipopolysaccharide transport system permease protein
MAGLFPWIIIAEGVLRGTSSLLENTNLIQKTAFPTEILAAKAVMAPILCHGIAIVILVVYRVATGVSPVVILLVPLVLLLQTLFTLGVAFLTSTTSIFFRDVLQLVNLLVGFWIYITPILYPMTMLPEWANKAMYFNPVYPLVSLYQSLLLEGSVGPWHIPVLAALISCGLFMFGSFVFSKLKFEFADWL